jgi:predicted permease
VDFDRVLILNTLAPVFLLIALGAGLQASRFLSPGFLREANRVVYWVGLPALLFSQLARLGRGVGDATPMLGVMLAATVAVALLSYPVAAGMGVRPGAKGTFAQGVLRGNLAFVGLPIIYELPDVTLAGGLSLRTAAVRGASASALASSERDRKFPEFASKSGRTSTIWSIFLFGISNR